VDNGQSFFRFVVRMILVVGGIWLLISRLGTPMLFQESSRGRSGELVFAPDVGQILKLIIGFVIVWIIAGIIAGTIYVLPQWNRAVVLRLGKFTRVAGPGFYIVPPFIYEVADILDLRVMNVPLTAQQSLTTDNVPVDVEAVLFYQLQAENPEHALLNVEDYNDSTMEAAHVALRAAIGEHNLEQLLSERERIGQHISGVISKQAGNWGVSIIEVSLKDVRIPGDLQQAMSRLAQAEQEKRARVTLAQAELESSKIMTDAAQAYANNPVALDLRRMNIAYEGMTAGNPTIMFVPTSSLDSLGGMASAAAMTLMSDGTGRNERPATNTEDPQS
jgi:regulator of protease activity HflC (stomatin/prohibitin superfamily)